MSVNARGERKERHPLFHLPRSRFACPHPLLPHCLLIKRRRRSPSACRERKRERGGGESFRRRAVGRARRLFSSGPSENESPSECGAPPRAQRRAADAASPRARLPAVSDFLSESRESGGYICAWFDKGWRGVDWVEKVIWGGEIVHLRCGRVTTITQYNLSSSGNRISSTVFQKRFDFCKYSVCVKM